MIPGSNLLSIALSVIAPQTASYYAFASRTTNDAGLDVATYAAAVTIRASIQPVPRNLVEQFGLDLQRNYITVYVPRNAVDVDRDVSGDQVIYGGDTYQLLSSTKWFPLDGWTAILCVKVPNA